MFVMLLSQLTGWPIGLSQPLQSPVKTNILEMKILRALQEWRMDARSNNLHFEVGWGSKMGYCKTNRLSLNSFSAALDPAWVMGAERAAPQLPIIQTTQATLCPINLLSLPLYSTQLFVGESIGHIWLVLSALCLCLVTHSHWLSTHFHFCNVSVLGIVNDSSGMNRTNLVLKSATQGFLLCLTNSNLNDLKNSTYLPYLFIYSPIQ